MTKRSIVRIVAVLVLLAGFAVLIPASPLFIALRHLRRIVEYVLYPEESHTYASSGRPDRRVDRMTRILDWFDRHLR